MLNEPLQDGDSPDSSTIPGSYCTRVEQIVHAYEDPTPRNCKTAPLGALAAAYKEALAIKDAAGFLEKAANQTLEALRDALRSRMKDEGIEKLTGDGITITLGEKTVVKIEPDKWEEIVRKLVELGEISCVQKRLTTSRVEEMLDMGIPLPDGLSLTEFSEITHRRS